MRYIFATVILILLAGCSAPIPPKTEFRINPKIPDKKISAGSCTQNTLKVAQAFSSDILMSEEMNYAQGDSKQYIYSKSQWSTSPNRFITDTYLSFLRGAEIFKSVQVAKSRSRNDDVLEINIEDFMQYFNEESSESYANAVITLTLIDSSSNSVRASKTFSSKIDVKSLDAQGGVDALNTALNSILAQSAEWFEEVCK